MKKLTALLLTVILLTAAFSFSVAEEAAKTFDPSVFAEFPNYEYDKFEKKWSCLLSTTALDNREGRGISIALQVNGTAGEKPEAVMLGLMPVSTRDGDVKLMNEAVLAVQLVVDDQVFTYDYVFQPEGAMVGMIYLAGPVGRELVNALAGAETVHVRYLTDGDIIREYPNVNETGQFTETIIPFCRILVESDYISFTDQEIGNAYEAAVQPRIQQIRPVTETKDDPASPVYMIADQDYFTLNPFDNTWEYAAYYGRQMDGYLITVTAFVRGGDNFLTLPMLEFGRMDKDNIYVSADTVNLIADDRLFIIKTHDGMLNGAEEGKEVMDAILSAKEIAVRITLNDGNVVTIDPVNMEDFAPIIHFFEVLRDAGYDAKIPEADREEGIKRFRENCSVTVR